MIYDNVVLYGRGATSVGEQIGKSTKEAQEIIDAFFKGFPKVKQWIDYSMDFAHKNGYVEDVAGRRRRLPDIQLPKFSITTGVSDFNPLLNTAGKYENENNVLLNKYNKLCNEAKSRKQLDPIIQQAAKEGVTIRDNGGFIAQAERQSVNARVQGGAATLTKCALNMIYRDDRLNNIGARLINTVHDEILMEVPEENSEEAEKYLQEDMIVSARQYVPEVPMKCDTYNVNCWYEDEMEVTLQSALKNYIKGNPDKGVSGMSDEAAFNKLCAEYKCFTPERINKLLGR